MDKKVAMVLNGYLALDSEGRDELIDEIDKYRNGKAKENDIRKSIRESARTTINFGPLPTGCPCCGR